MFKISGLEAADTAGKGKTWFSRILPLFGRFPGFKPAYFAPFRAISWSLASLVNVGTPTSSGCNPVWKPNTTPNGDFSGLGRTESAWDHPFPRAHRVFSSDRSDNHLGNVVK